MKKTELKKLREKTVEELQKQVASLTMQRDRARADISAGKESNLKKSMLLKREIAQYLTLIRQKATEGQAILKKGQNK